MAASEESRILPVVAVNGPTGVHGLDSTGYAMAHPAYPVGPPLLVGAIYFLKYLPVE